MCLTNSVFFFLRRAHFLHAVLHVLCVVRVMRVLVFDSWCAWSAVGVMSVICDVCTVRGHAWSVCLTVCVAFTLRTMVHVHCVQ